MLTVVTSTQRITGDVEGWAVDITKTEKTFNATVMKKGGLLGGPSTPLVITFDNVTDMESLAKALLSVANQVKG